MTQLNMLSYKLQDMQFFNKLDKPGQVQLENNFSYSVDYNKENWSLKRYHSAGCNIYVFASDFKLSTAA